MQLYVVFVIVGFDEMIRTINYDVSVMGEIS